MVCSHSSLEILLYGEILNISKISENNTTRGTRYNKPLQYYFINHFGPFLWLVDGLRLELITINCHHKLLIVKCSCNNSTCDECQQGKSHRLPYPKSVSVSSKPFELIFFDVKEPWDTLFLEFKSIMPRPFNKHQKNKVITVLQFKSSGSSTRTEARNNTETTFNYSTR